MKIDVLSRHDAQVRPNGGSDLFMNVSSAEGALSAHVNEFGGPVYLLSTESGSHQLIQFRGGHAEDRWFESHAETYDVIQRLDSPSEIECLRAENAELRAEVERLRQPVHEGECPV